MSQAGGNDPFTFERHGRSTTAMAVLGLIYAGLLALYLFLDAAPWLLILLVLPTLPAVRDLIVNPSAGLTLTRHQIDWHSGRRSASVPLGQIDRVRLDTRWDLSTRVILILTDGKRVRLPAESLPQRKALIAALEAVGLPMEVHHFTVF